MQVWAVAFNDLADSLVAFGERVDMVGEKLWIPYRGDSPLASMFRIMLEVPRAPNHLKGPLLTLARRLLHQNWGGPPGRSSLNRPYG